MGGVLRSARKLVRKTGRELAKATGLRPSNKEIARVETAQKKAQEAQQAQMQDVIDAQSKKANPADVVYQQGESRKARRRKRRRSRSIMTGSGGVIGSADTERKTLLGG